MRTVLPMIGAACVLGVSACSHVQSPEAGTSTAELTVARVDTMPIKSETESAPSASASASDMTSKVETRPSALAMDPQAPQQEASDPLVGTSAAAEATAGERAGGAIGEGEQIGRFLLTRGIEQREPVDAAESFAPGERVYAFLEVANPDGGEYALNLRWVHEDDELGQPVALTIGASPHWRTWSWRRAPEQPGSYRCIVETAEGQQVGEIPFHVDNI